MLVAKYALMANIIAVGRTKAAAFGSNECASLRLVWRRVRIGSQWTTDRDSGPFHFSVSIRSALPLTVKPVWGET
jgi:hypothetical protein